MASYGNNIGSSSDKRSTGGQSSASSTAADLSQKASEYAAKAGEQVSSMVEGAESTARAVADQAREGGERVQEVAGNMKTAIDKSVRDQPMATLAVAAAVGFVMGALWKS